MSAVVGEVRFEGRVVLRRLREDVLRGADDDGEHERRRAERGDQREERLVEEDEAEEDAWRDGMEWTEWVMEAAEVVMVVW